MAEETVIALETRQAVLQVVEVKRGNRRALVRVSLGEIDLGRPTTCMWVSMPHAVRLPAVGAVVAFEGLRLVLVEVAGMTRPVVRANGLREVASDVAA